MININVVPHIASGEEMIEIWRDGDFIAGIYPHDSHMTIVSKHIKDAGIDKGNPTTVVIDYSKEV